MSQFTIPLEAAEVEKIQQVGGLLRVYSHQLFTELSGILSAPQGAPAIGVASALLVSMNYNRDVISEVANSFIEGGGTPSLNAEQVGDLIAVRDTYAQDAFDLKAAIQTAIHDAFEAGWIEESKISDLRHSLIGKVEQMVEGLKGIFVNLEPKFSVLERINHAPGDDLTPPR